MAHIAILALIALSFLCVVVYVELWFEPHLGVAEVLESLSNLQERTMDALVEKTSFLMGLSTALFGMIGYVVLQLSKSRPDFDFFSKALLVFSLGLVVISLDFGYNYLQKWAEMLYIGAFKPFDPIVLLNQKLQFYTFLGAVVSTALWFYRINLVNK